MGCFVWVTKKRICQQRNRLSLQTNRECVMKGWHWIFTTFLMHWEFYEVWKMSLINVSRCCKRTKNIRDKTKWTGLWAPRSQTPLSTDNTIWWMGPFQQEITDRWRRGKGTMWVEASLACRPYLSLYPVLILKKAWWEQIDNKQA